MYRILSIIFFCCFWSIMMLAKGFAQDRIGAAPDSAEEKPIYYEAQENGMMRFYFDQYYFLSDKFCPFTSIEREAGFDFGTNSFEGTFTDYDQHGRVILTGSYHQGLKHGTFKAFHGNGQLKWERTYVDDLPEGEATYFYPDGKPMISVWHGERGVEIRDYWNQTGSRRVENGRGRYEMRVEIDGYNEYGALFIERKGRIRDGKPHGNWSVSLVYPDQSTAYLGVEHYQNGRLTGIRDAALEKLLQSTSSASLLPTDLFARAEAMISKNCTIDEHTGFTGYLEWYLESWFENEKREQVDPQLLRFKISIDSEGGIVEAEAIDTFDDELYARYLLHGLRAVHWIPSWSGDQYIADTLEVSFDVMSYPGRSGLLFFNTRIVRELGN